MNRFIVFIFLLSSISVMVSSCKKGCTNKNAINYSPSANDDDASCLFCDSIVVDSSDRSGIWIESNSGSHYHDTMFNVISKVVLFTYSGNHCAALGKKTICNTQSSIRNFAYAIFKITNVRTDTISIDGSIGFWLDNQNNSTFYLQNHVLPPGAELNLGSPIYFGCVQHNSATQNYNTDFTVTY